MSEFTIGGCLEPTDNLTGCGIIINIKTNCEKRVPMLGKYSLQVLTDFGNIMNLTEQEMKAHYRQVRVGNIKERFLRQQELLLDAKVYLQELGLMEDKGLSYIDKYKRGVVSEEDIHTFIEEWHESTSELDLHEYLGMTWKEYQTWVANPTLCIYNK